MSTISIRTVYLKGIQNYECLVRLSVILCYLTRMVKYHEFSRYVLHVFDKVFII